MESLNTSLVKNINLKKHNALTDGYIPKAGKELLPDKLLNALSWRYEVQGNKFIVSKTELRELLGLKSSKDDRRVEEALTMLATPIQVRNYEYKGEKIAWAAVSFLNSPKRYMDSSNYEITINEEMVEVLKQKVGYTLIELEVSNSFRTKYALKLYELYKRYYSLPNNKGAEIGTIAKNMEELNKIFGTSFKHASKMLEGINRGLAEIEKKTSIFMNCYYDKRQKAFIFAWHQHIQHPKLRIPLQRVNELIEWYIKHKNPQMKNPVKYRQALREKIIDDTFGDLDPLWQGMLQYRYGFTKEEVKTPKLYNKKTNKWKNFTRKPQPGLV